MGQCLPITTTIIITTAREGESHKSIEVKCLFTSRGGIFSLNPGMQETSQLYSAGVQRQESGNRRRKRIREPLKILCVQMGQVTRAAVKTSGPKEITREPYNLVVIVVTWTWTGPVPHSLVIANRNGVSLITLSSRCSSRLTHRMLFV